MSRNPSGPKPERAGPKERRPLYYCWAPGCRRITPNGQCSLHERFRQPRYTRGMEVIGIDRTSLREQMRQQAEQKQNTGNEQVDNADSEA